MSIEVLAKTCRDSAVELLNAKKSAGLLDIVNMVTTFDEVRDAGRAVRVTTSLLGRFTARLKGYGAFEISVDSSSKRVRYSFSLNKLVLSTSEIKSGICND